MRAYVFDIETYRKLDNRKLTDKRDKIGDIEFGLAVIKVLNRDKFYVFEDKESFKNFILSLVENKHKEKIYFIGFNIYNFDNFTFFNNIELVKYFDILINKNYKILSMFSKNKKIVLYDLFNIFPLSLKELGKYVNLEKGNMQKELAIMDKDEFEQRKKEIVEYCKQDVVITEKIFNEFYDFLNKNGITSLPLTPSQLSFKLYNLLNGNKINGKEINNDYLFLESYYGGRTEYFYLGKFNKSIYAYDFNSLYPFVMVRYKYPVEFVKSEVLPDYDNFIRDIYNFEGLGIFEIYAENTIYYLDNDKKIEIGLLPYKYNEKIIYPKGKWIGIYNLNEIKFSIENGYKVKPLYVEYWRAEKLNKIDEFVSYWYNIKKQKKGLLSVIAKIVLNSLYGKFMQINQGYDIKLLESEEDYFNYEVIEDGLNIGINRNTGMERGRSTFLSIGSYITSYARIELLKKMKEAIKKNAKILYCDTDSLFLDVKVFQDEKDLGKVKIEKEGKNINIFSAKSYILNYDNENRKIVIKGIPKRAKQIDEYNYEYDRMIRFISFLKQNDFYTLKEHKTISYDNEKRKHNKIDDFTDIVEINDMNLYITKEINKEKIEKIRKELADKGYYLNIYAK